MRAQTVTANPAPFLLAEYIRRAVYLALCACTLIAMSGQARAGDATLHQQFHATYQQLLANPSDIDTTLRYAQLAVALGDYEAAIPPLERLVMMNPRLHRTKLKLGTLYLNLGSKLMARSYFEEVANAPDAPADIVQVAKQHLQSM